MEVAIATHEMFEKWIKEKSPGTSFFPLKGDPVAMLSSPELKKALFEGGVYMKRQERREKREQNMEWS